MNPVTEITEQHMHYWVDYPSRLSVFTAPDDPPGCVPCKAIITLVNEGGRDFSVVRVPWKPDEIELVHMARGGTVWLSTWGGLPAHMIEVQEPWLKD